MQSKVSTVAEYLDSLPDDRRAMVDALRKAIRKTLDKKYEETMQYGMITYVVPHRVYPAGYHVDPKQALPFASIASQKNAVSLYLMPVYGSESESAWFREEWKARGKRLDAGKSCFRIKRLDDVPLDLVTEAIARWPATRYIKAYESILTSRTSKTVQKSTKRKSTRSK